MIKEQKKKKCAVCKEPFIPKRIGLKVTKVCLNAACVLDYAQGIRDKELQRKERENAKINAQKKRDFLAGDIKFQKAKAQKAFNEYIRLRDSHLPCISCDKPSDWHGQWHAGHYKTVGARPDLRFDEDNCHKQCSVCNNYLSGNLAMYHAGLIQKIGSERVAALEAVNPIGRLTAEYYAGVHSYYTGLCKELKCKEK